LRLELLDVKRQTYDTQRRKTDRDKIACVEVVEIEAAIERLVKEPDKLLKGLERQIFAVRNKILGVVSFAEKRN